MRRIVRCPDCSRRYDASKREIGSHFHCRCGKSLTVAAAEGHESEVIRCSACGGSREQGSDRCGFCGADFTIHEQDLNTVCPDCLARVSDRARFCCHCGAMLAGEDLAGDEAELACPVCGDEAKLNSRRLGRENLNVLECSRCAGLWIGHETFALLRERVVREATPGTESNLPKPAPAAAMEQQGPRYRLCITCGKMMQRRAYGRGSGVIVDICREHGVWFDDRELQRILQWVAHGGRIEDRSQTSDGEKAEKEKKRRGVSSRPILGEPDFDDPQDIFMPGWGRRRPGGDLITALIRVVVEEVAEWFVK